MTTTKNPSGDQADRSPAADTTNPSDPPRTADLNGDNIANGRPLYAPEHLLELTVQNPMVGICVATIEGELDALSAPLLDTRIQEQLTAAPTHLILDLQSVRFLGSNGLTSLLHARELAQTTGTQLHLAGMVTRVVARSLQVTGLVELFDTYATVNDALAALVD
jgi:anti-sigma B factor antagonist